MSQYRSRQSKMWLIIYVAFCISLSAGRVVDDDYYNLDGEDQSSLLPKKYTVKARKTSLTGNLVEDFVYWLFCKNRPRLCNNNNGTNGTTDSPKLTEYEIYPETDKDEKIEYVCAYMYEDDVNIFTLGIPGIEDKNYDMQGNETVFGYEAIKFDAENEYTNSYGYYALWATKTSVGDKSIWTPLRYEEKEYNTILGALTKHAIWDFYEFDVDFDEHEVYDLKDLGCIDSNTVKVTHDSDAVVKELKFINPENQKHVDHVFNSFKSKFNPKYAHEKEHNLRKSIFKQNMRLISSTNRRNLGYKLGVNKFADRTHEEMKKTGYRRRSEGVTGNMPFPYTQKTLNALADKLPKEVDLRLQGLVSPVKDQADCSSWTFGTTAAVEGALARINGGKLMALSNQALIDCAWAYENADGCHSGSDDAAYKWMMQYGLPTEEEYGPYLNQNGYCHIENMTTLYTIKGFTDVTRKTKKALKVALFNHGPLSVSIDATDKFDLYLSGVFYDEDCNKSAKHLNHEVALVGYGVENGKLFWVLKNSFGPYWGLEGYMLISAKQDCGVSTEPTYVVF